MLAAIYARKSTEQTGVSEKDRVLYHHGED